MQISFWSNDSRVWKSSSRERIWATSCCSWWPTSNSFFSGSQGIAKRKKSMCILFFCFNFSNVFKFAVSLSLLDMLLGILCKASWRTYPSKIVGSSGDLKLIFLYNKEIISLIAEIWNWASGLLTEFMKITEWLMFDKLLVITRNKGGYISFVNHMIIFYWNN